jgi:hypothetical protein
MDYLEGGNRDRLDYTFALVLLRDTRIFREKDLESLNNRFS